MEIRNSNRVKGKGIFSNDWNTSDTVLATIVIVYALSFLVSFSPTL